MLVACTGCSSKNPEAAHCITSFRVYVHTVCFVCACLCVRAFVKPGEEFWGVAWRCSSLRKILWHEQHWNLFSVCGRKWCRRLSECCGARKQLVFLKTKQKKKEAFPFSHHLCCDASARKQRGARRKSSLSLTSGRLEQTANCKKSSWGALWVPTTWYNRVSHWCVCIIDKRHTNTCRSRMREGRTCIKEAEGGQHTHAQAGESVRNVCYVCLHRAECAAWGRQLGPFVLLLDRLAGMQPCRSLCPPIPPTHTFPRYLPPKLPLGAAASRSLDFAVKPKHAEVERKQPAVPYFWFFCNIRYRFQEPVVEFLSVKVSVWVGTAALQSPSPGTVRISVNLCTERWSVK